jgi:hypothetical protein
MENQENQENNGYFVILQWHSYRKEEDLIVSKAIKYLSKNKDEKYKEAKNECEKYAMSARKYWVDNCKDAVIYHASNIWKPDAGLNNPIDIKDDYAESGFENETVIYEIFDVKSSNIYFNDENNSKEKDLYLKIQYSLFKRSPISFEWTKDNSEHDTFKRLNGKFGDRITTWCFLLDNILIYSEERDKKFWSSWLYY